MSSDPLSLRHLRILVILTGGPLHGYAIGAAIEEDTGGSVALRPGSLYRALHQLLERGLVAEVAADDDADARRRSYALTPEGRAALAEELGRVGELVDRARSLGVIAGGV